MNNNAGLHRINDRIGAENGGPSREPAVAMAIKELESEFENLAGSVTTLRQRLDPVSRPPSPATKEEGKMVGSAVLVVARLQELRGNIAILNRCVVDALDRLEV